MAIGLHGPFDGLEFGEGLSETVPPFLSGQTPAPSDTNVSVSANVNFTIDDLDSGVILSTVTVQIDSGSGFVTAYTSSAFQAGFTGSATLSGIGYAFVVNPTVDFPSSQLVQVRVQGSDADGNSLDSTYSFTTEAGSETNPPYLELQDPAPSETGVDLNADILFRVTDDPDDIDSGVDVSTLVVSVQVGAGPIVAAYDAFLGGFQPGFSGSVVDVFLDQLSYDVTINPSIVAWPGLTTITVYVEVDDTKAVPNHLDTSYSFTTKAAETSAPYLSHQSPAPGSGPAGNPRSTSISFRVNDDPTDPDSGVDIGTLHVEIQRGAGQPWEDAILGGVFQSGFTGTITDLGGGLSYSVVINPDVDLFDADTTSVRVNVDDTKA